MLPSHFPISFNSSHTQSLRLEQRQVKNHGTTVKEAAKAGSASPPTARTVAGKTAGRSAGPCARFARTQQTHSEERNPKAMPEDVVQRKGRF